MKHRVRFTIPTILIIALLGACSSQAPEAPAALPPTSPPPTVAPAASPVPAEPTVEPTSTVAPLPTLPAADATITVAGKECKYDGPDPIPAGDSLSVNWYINSSESPLYGLLVFVLDEGKTAEDLRGALKSEVPADWISQAGTFSSSGNNGKQVTVQLAQGVPLRGPLYFTCWAGESEDTAAIFATLGPYEVK
jgi:hypothetical protein